jgi:hypothetical protein
MKEIKVGSLWWGGGDKKFRVLSVVEQEGNKWVHYIDHNSKEPREYSCFAESFVDRFMKLPE